MKFSSSPNRPEAWKEMKLVDICKTFTSGGTPSRKRPEYFENGTIPWVRTKELNDGIITEVEEFITSEALKNSSAKMLPKNTVLLAMYGATVGKLGVLGFESSCNQACAAMVPKDGIVDYRYLYYLLLNHRELIISQATGGAQQNLSGELIKGFTFDFPTYKEQQAISEVLWKIDEKIAANNALSKTLEGIAQTIFKSWFIDFDPVKAKMAGEKPAGMDAATAELFPDSMEESELGLIPKGWEVIKVENLVTRLSIKGLPKSTNLLFMGKTMVLEQGDLVISGFIEQDADVNATGNSPKFIFGDHTCRMRLSTLPFSVFPNTIVLDSRYRNVYWAYQATNGLQKFETYRRHWMELAYKLVIVPSPKLADIFGAFVKPLYELIDNLMLESRRLAELRDTLLPRLISGELQIPEEMLVS